MADSKSILAAVSHLLSFAADGALDWEGSGAALRAQIEGEIAENRELDGRIERAIDSIYDKVPEGTGVETAAIVQTTASILAGGDFLKQKEFANKVADYLKRSTRFVGKRGRSGGLFRVG